MTDEAGMRAAVEQALAGLAAGEVPVGAVLAIDDRIISRAFNQPIGAVDPTAHAEVLVMREAARATGNYRLTGATVYVTHEPCLMCVGAMVHARVARVVYGAVEPRTGALVSVTPALDLSPLNHRFEVTGGMLEAECREILQRFFRETRARERATAEPAGAGRRRL